MSGGGTTRRLRSMPGRRGQGRGVRRRKELTEWIDAVSEERGEKEEVVEEVGLGCGWRGGCGWRKSGGSGGVFRTAGETIGGVFRTTGEVFRSAGRAFRTIGVSVVGRSS